MDESDCSFSVGKGDAVLKGPGPELMTSTPFYIHEFCSVHATGPLVTIVYMYSKLISTFHS